MMVKHSCILLAAVLMIGCSVRSVPVADRGDKGLPEPEIVLTDEHEDSEPDSRMVVSNNLTKEGYRYLENDDPDSAIRVLERAVGINPSDGPGYFYLAEAWLRKENVKLAKQFNKLAMMYLRNDQAWAGRARDQKKRITDLKKSLSSVESI